ncbi:hypothetical protein [Chitinimonas sp. BJYL2]|uniref:hypothetical protein n=1 Tax=Chitinimonas sp. BJYL2 TaxID=2976696 RepID=UPI0022B383A7|nr:hypothetical protein [Chitinimonas sp. BJYL2]
MEDAALIDDTVLAALHEATLIAVASRSAARQPSIGPALACRVSADRRTVQLWLPRDAVGLLLTHILICGRIAVAVPTADSLLQLKGSDARVTEPADDDLVWLAARSSKLQTAGDLVAVCFTPDDIVWQAGRTGSISGTPA